MSARGSEEFGVQLGDVAFCTRVHNFQSGEFTCLAFEPGDEIREVEATAKVSVTFLGGQPGSTTLRIKDDMTFDVYFRSSYPETPPVVHVVRGGGCDAELLDTYEDPRIDRGARGTLYSLRICDPADGWFSSYDFSCVVFALRWTVTRTLRGSLVKPSDISRLGACFKMKDTANTIGGPSAPGHVQCWSLHHEEQGYRESMEDVILALDEFSLGVREDTGRVPNVSTAAYSPPCPSKTA